MTTNTIDITAVSDYSLSDISLDYGNITLTTGSGTNYSGGFSGYSSGSVVIGAAGSTSPIWTNTSVAPMTVQQSGRIDLKGEGADLVVNGESMIGTLKEIREVLKIPGRLQRDERLEAEFDELKQAAEHYQQLLEKYRDQKRVWDILKTQD